MNPLFLLIAISLVSCTPLKPWERGNLAKEEALSNSQAFQHAIHDHIFSSREAMTTTSNRMGGGCGCN